MAFAVITTTNARRDMQQAIDWENLGARFLEFLHLKFTSLSITPFIGSVRYENVRAYYSPLRGSSAVARPRC